MDGVAGRLALPTQVRRRARDICEGATAMHLERGMHRAALAAASLYVGCRESKIPITLRDLAAASESDPDDVGRCYVSLLDRMHISRPDLNGRRYVYHLGLKRPVTAKALRKSQEIIRMANGRGLGGRNPMTLAAAALYLACRSVGERITQAEVAEAAGVYEMSVRECCKAIRTLANQPATGSH